MAELIKQLYKKGDDTTLIYPNIKGDNIPSNAVTSDKIANSAITSNKINDGAVTQNKIADGSVSTAKIGNNAITNAKILDGTISEEKLDFHLYQHKYSVVCDNGTQKVTFLYKRLSTNPNAITNSTIFLVMLYEEEGASTISSFSYHDGFTPNTISPDVYLNYIPEPINRVELHVLDSSLQEITFIASDITINVVTSKQIF